MKRLLLLPLLLFTVSAGEAWTISTANNAVASATFYLKFYLVP